MFKLFCPYNMGNGSNNHLTITFILWTTKMNKNTIFFWVPKKQKKKKSHKDLERHEDE